MKMTLLAYPNGDVLITKPHRDRDISSDVGEAQSVTRVGTIVECDGIYNTEFQLDELKVYNKRGFHSRDEAIAYEQDILDTHLAEILVDKI